MMPDGFGELLGRLGPGAVAAAIGAMPVMVGAAIWLTRMVLEAKIERLQAEVDRIKHTKDEDATRAKLRAQEEAELATKRYAELDERFGALNLKYQAMLTYGANLQLQLDEIIAEATRVAGLLDVQNYSILAPAPTIIPGDKPQQLVFLYASGTQAETLRWVRVPMKSSFSGEAFLKDKTLIGRKTVGEDKYANATDGATQTNTEETLSVCLRHRGQPVAIAQFVNKRSDDFTLADSGKASEECRLLAVRVGDFLSDPKRLIDLGYAPRQPDVNVTVMFVDLTGFTHLFRDIDSSLIIERLNQYFHETCRIATGRGALVDQYMGDGMMLVFNAEQTTPDHATVAIEAALAMRSAFRALRARWVKLGERPLERLFIRIGLSSGDVTPAEVGQPRSRHSTFIGGAVNAAAKACAAAPRGRDTICVAAETPPAGAWRAAQLLAQAKNGCIWEIDA